MSKNISLRIIFSVILLLGTTNTAIANIIYVNANSACSTNCDGTSWGLGYKDLQLALAAAGANDSIWLAQGKYHPTTSGRFATFDITEGIKIFGGFAGTETLFSQRDITAHVGWLSGDLLENDQNGNADTTDVNRYENSYHVLTINAAVTSATILDGIYIIGGSAYDHLNLNLGYEGGGLAIYNVNANPIIRNCNFQLNISVGGGGAVISYGRAIFENCTWQSNLTQAQSNGGGAIKCTSSSADTFRNCKFTYNVAGGNGSGGAVLVQNAAHPQFYDCWFDHNICNGTYNEGGAMYIVSGSNAAHVNFTNCIFSNNTGTLGTVNMWGSMATFYNCTFYGNSADALYVGAGGSPTTRPVAYNSIFYSNGGNENNNATVKPDYYSCLLESPTCIGNSCNCSQFSLNPLFVNPAANDFSLQNLSPAVNTGDNAHVTETLDFSGNNRIFFSIVDLGAVESGNAQNAEMVVADSTSQTEIYDNSNPAEFVGTTVGDTITKIFKLFNSGSATMMLCGWTITGDFSFTLPADSVLLVTDPFTTITIRGHASSVGVSTGVLTIGNNDLDGPFQLNLRQTIQLATEKNSELVVYEGLSPNGDGKNDYLRIDNIDQYPNSEVHIYDRLGNLVAHYNGYENETNCWKGEYQQGNKKRVVNGTYYYVLRTDKAADPKKGFLTLQE